VYRKIADRKLVYDSLCLHGIVTALPGLSVKTCTVTIFPSTHRVLPEKETVSGPVQGCIVAGSASVIGGSVEGRPVEVEGQIQNICYSE